MRRGLVSLPSLVPLAVLCWAWAYLGEPLHRDGLYAVLALSAVGAVLMPGVVVSVEALPRLLVPNSLRIWWRHGQDHRPTIPAYLRRAVYAADGYQCCYCKSLFQLQVDHIRPWSLGGLNALWNLATLCGPCNRAKSNYWVTRRGYVYYRPFEGGNYERTAAAILRYEKRHRWHPLRWVRAGLSLAS